MSTSERVAGVLDTTLATVGEGAQMTQFVLGNFYGGTALTTEQMSSGTVTVNNVSRGTTGIDVAATSMQLTGAGVSILAGAVEFGQGVRNAYDLSYIHHAGRPRRIGQVQRLWSRADHESFRRSVIRFEGESIVLALDDDGAAKGWRLSLF